MHNYIKAIFISLVMIDFGCSKEVEPINYHKDECSHCMMTITDPKFGSELVTEKGKVYKFDSIECLADYLLLDRGFKVNSLWISDFSNPNTLIDAKKAYFILSDKISSPMGMNLAGVKSEETADKLLNELGGRKLSWDDVVEYIKSSK